MGNEKYFRNYVAIFEIFDNKALTNFEKSKHKSNDVAFRQY